MLRFHTQTGGATLTAQQPENNIVRTTLEALSAVLGGTQSLHTNSFDEALALPTEAAAKLALRTQQVIGLETGVASVADPFGGSFYLEALTDEIDDRRVDLPGPDRRDGRRRGRDRARLLPGRDPRGGLPDPAGDRVGRAASSWGSTGSRRTRSGPSSSRRSGEEEVARQVERVRRLRHERDAAAVDAALGAVADAARGTANVLVPMREALRVRATLGEVSDVLRSVFGEYRPV